MDRLISLQAAIDALEMAIQALSSKGDMVYRQATIDTVVAWTVEDKPDIEMPTDLIDRIKNMPSAQPEPQWIPCSERLPEVDESVLVTTEWNDISIAWRTGIDEWLIHEGNTNATTDDLTAWMPLPEPYKERREE